MDKVSVNLSLNDLNGEPGIEVGEQFEVQISFLDIRGVLPATFNPQDVFSGYVDVNFDDSLLQVDEIIYPNSFFPILHTGTIGDGIVDEVGATSNQLSPINPSGSLSEFALQPIVTLRMTALADGATTLTTDAGEAMTSQITIYGEDGDQNEFTLFGSLPVQIGNSTPVAQNDNFSGPEDTAIAGNVLTNDSDPDGDSLTVTLQSPVSNGSLTLNSDGSFSYAPNPNFNGTDSFSYVVSDGELSDTATVNLTVTPVNDAPIARNDTAIAGFNQTIVIPVLANDLEVDGNPVNFSAISEAANGTVINNNTGTLTYTPNAGFTGSDSFTYTLIDPQGATSTATVNITVSPDVNLALPIVTDALDDITALDNADDAVINLLNHFDDPFTTGLVARFELFETSLGGGVTEVLLFDQADAGAPLTVQNFLNYVNDGDYVNSIIHRSVPGFIVQGGGFTVDGLADTLNSPANAVALVPTDPPVVNEFSPDRSNVRGTIAMAKLGNNPNSATSQWFFNLSDNSVNLDNQNGGFTVFGEVLSATDLAAIDAIAAVETYDGRIPFQQNAFSDLPLLQNINSLTGDEDFVRYRSITVSQQDELEFSIVDNSNSQLLNASINNNQLVLDYLPGQTGTTAITIRATNLLGEVVEDTFSITVEEAPNILPSADNDSATTLEDAAIALNILDGDTDSDGTLDPTTVAIVNGPSNGTVTVNPNGIATYTPAANFSGTDSFTYTVQDNDGGTSNEATVAITVEAVNDAPAADSAGFTTNEDVALEGTVTATDIDGDELTFSLTAGASNGTVTVNDNGSFTYTPNANFFGTDSFSYAVTDGELTDTATVSLTVDPVNDAPVAADDIGIVNITGSATIDVLANDTDVDGDTLSVSSVGTPANGVAALDNGTVTYTPDAGFVGTDSFTYTVSDGNDTDTATVTVTVEGPENTAPIALDDAFATDEDVELTGTVANNDTDAEDDTLTFSLEADVTNGELALNADGSFTYTPNSNFFGTDSFTYFVSDGQLTSTATVSLTVNAVNDAPVADSAGFTTNEDVALEGTVTATDIDGDGLTFSLAAGASNGTVTVTDNGSFTYTPSANFFGTDSFSYAVTDGELTDTATVSVTVDPVNDAPVAADDSGVVGITGSATINVLANDTDVDGDTLSVSSVGTPANGVAALDNGTVTYTPDAGFVGTDSFTYTVSDGNDTDTATVTVTITVQGPENTAPIALDDAFATDEDVELTGTVANNDTDAEDDTLTFSLETDVTNGELALNEDGSFTYTPNPNFFGTDSFTYFVSDGQLTDTAEVSFAIEPVNDAPVAVDDIASTNAGETVTIDILGNDTDVDGDELSFTLGGGPANGTLIVNDDGTIAYTPAPGFVGSDTFSYVIGDSQLTDTATVTVTVEGPENTAPIALDDAFATDEDVELTGTVANNDTDAEDDTLTFSLETDVTNGELALNEDGSFTYTPNANFFGTDSFSYVVTDGALTDAATVSITVDPVNDAPVAADDSGVVGITGSATINVLANDSDVDGDTLSVSSVEMPANGDAVLNPDGTVTYTPDAGFGGTDSFTYIVSDGNDTDTATVTVTVPGSENTAPIAVDDDFATDEDVELTGTVAGNDTDAEGDTLTFSLETDVTSGELALAADGSFTYAPNPNFFGTDSFTYIVSDGQLTDSATVNIAIAAVNDPPTASDDSFSTNQGQALSGDVSTNDSDGDDELNFSLVSETSNGTIDFNPDGTFSYAPASGFTGTDSFTYEVSDGEFTDLATVTINVQFIDEGVTLVGDTGDDDLEGGRGNDLIAGDLGDDVIRGGDGDDVLRGDLNSRSPQVGEAGGNDIIYGGAGNDRIGGKSGDDQLFGDEGDDQIWGDDGDDLLRGGLGNDTLTGDDRSGGRGSDIFVLAAGEGTDTIVDFQVGTDFIGLADGLTFGSLTFDGNRILFGTEVLAILNKVNTTTLTEANFTTLFP